MMVSSLPQLAPMSPPAFTTMIGGPPSMEIFLSSRISTEKCQPLPIWGKERSAVGAFGARHGFGSGVVQRAQVDLSYAVMNAYECNVVPHRGNGHNGSSEARELLRRRYIHAQPHHGLRSAWPEIPDGRADTSSNGGGTGQTADCAATCHFEPLAVRDV
jgi:hypothetical protein